MGNCLSQRQGQDSVMFNACYVIVAANNKNFFKWLSSTKFMIYYSFSCVKC